MPAVGAPVVEERRHVVGTADVERASDTAADPHPPVQRRRHEDHIADAWTRRDEVFPKAVLPHVV